MDIPCEPAATESGRPPAKTRIEAASRVLTGVGSNVSSGGRPDSVSSSGGTARCAKLPGVPKLSRLGPIAAALLAALSMLLLAAPLALADNGAGLAGPTTDKTITFFCFGVIGFFAILVIVLSLIQGRLEKRKERRRYDLERYG